MTVTAVSDVETSTTTEADTARTVLPKMGALVHITTGRATGTGRYVGQAEYQGPDHAMILLRADDSVHVNVLPVLLCGPGRAQITVLDEEPDGAVARELAQTSARLAAVTAEHERHVAALVEAAHEWADDAGLCSSFDQFMESQGLPGRERSYYIDVVIRGRVQVTATSADDAKGSLDVGNALRELGDDPDEAELSIVGCESSD